jgi:murein DD-endopeptidase MepM/ murein hydrolase activator NlpD
MKTKIDGLALIMLALTVFLGASLLSGTHTSLGGASSIPRPSPLPEASAADPAAIAAPYDTYVVTQGPHGASYGHMAIDIAAGEGTPIKSPINGTVTDLYIDVYGNPTLVIENEYYRVTLLHGIYTVSIGQSLALGDIVGSESNQGYTTDMVGNACWGRSGCGYHTHLNIYDKRIQSNVNPLDLLSP